VDGKRPHPICRWGCGFGCVESDPINYTDPLALFDSKKFFKYNKSIDGPCRSKCMKRLDKVEEYLFSKLLNKLGIITPSLTGVLGKIGDTRVGAISFVLTNPTSLNDPYPDGKGGLIFPSSNNEECDPCQEQ